VPRITRPAAASSRRPAFGIIRRVEELRGGRVILRLLRKSDAAALKAIVAQPDVARWWGPQEESFPFDEPESTRFAILVDGEVAGLVQYGEEEEPDFRHAWIDVFVDASRHGQGLGTEAVERLLRHLIEDRGHHRVTIDPALDNRAAVRAYEKAGFEPVGVMRSSWRDPEGVWRDSLLMEHVAEASLGRK
jgi:aminoglycoside 6'-N-acetyltransferase